MRTSETVEGISKALVAFQAEMEGVAKGAENPFFHSKYADLPAILGAVKPVAEKHGLAIIQSIKSVDGGLIECTSRIIHESGEWIEGNAVVYCDKATPQGYGSATTYVRRYGIQAVLGLSAVDDDGNAAEKDTTEKPQTQTNGARCAENAKDCDYIMQITKSIVGEDKQAGLDVLKEWSAVKGKNGNEMYIKSWDDLYTAPKTWVDHVKGKADEADERF